jgi:hypothetical protein
MKLNLSSLPSPGGAGWSVALALALALQVVLYRETLQDALRDGRKRLLVFKTMHRRFASSSEESADGTGSTDGLMSSQKKLVLVMVGLPARGKSFVVHKTLRYIEWLGFPTRMFNVGNLRRKLGKAGEDAKFFAADNSDATKLREEMAMEALDGLLEWLETQGHVAVFDATNTTRMRRYGAQCRSGMGETFQC